jgi:hypothetical protein
MEAPQPAAVVRFRAGLGFALTIVVGAFASPAAAAAGPVEDVTERPGELTQPIDQAVERAGGAVPGVRQPVEQTVARITPTVEAVTGARPIRSTVQAVTASVARVPPQATPASTTVDGRSESIDPAASSPSPQATRRPDAGWIDRHASRRSGRAQARPLGSEAPLDSIATPQDALNTPTSVEQARSEASSTSAAGDDGGLDIGQPPFGFDGGGSMLGGPVGVALLALGLLTAMLMLVPRFFTRLLRMSAARWGPSAFLRPVERPG